MRLTVGPLPAAVYWRRRVIVLGAVLFAFVLLVYNCAGPDPSGAANTPGASRPPSSGSVPLLTPIVGGSAESGDPPAASVPASVPAGAQPTGPCTDGDITVSVATENGRTEFAAGAYVRIYLKIKNTSGRTCTRDIGAMAQELRIQQGAQTLWSSDDCATGPTAAPDPHTFRPGDQLDQFFVVWNGRASTDCQTKPVAPAGAYQIVGRFGTRWSDPLAITVKG